MPSLVPPPGADGFEPDVVKAMTLAYHRALHELHDKGQPAIVREVLARRIIDAAAAGEHDSERLCEIALGHPLESK